MKFEEKLIKLRQKNSISQEELAKKLNVSKELVEEWELGKSKPNMDKIVEMASLFNVSTDQLLNEMDSNVDQNTVSNEDDKKNNKTIIIIVVSIVSLVIVLCIAGFFAFRAIFGLFNNIQNKTFNNFDKAMNKIIDKGEEIEEKRDAEFDKKFNNSINSVNEKFNDSVNKIEEQLDNSANKIENQITNSLDNMFQQFSF